VYKLLAANGLRADSIGLWLILISNLNHAWRVRRGGSCLTVTLD
jgi:hypothetical protein